MRSRAAFSTSSLSRIRLAWTSSSELRAPSASVGSSRSSTRACPRPTARRLQARASTAREQHWPRQDARTARHVPEAAQPVPYLKLRGSVLASESLVADPGRVGCQPRGRRRLQRGDPHKIPPVVQLNCLAPTPTAGTGLLRHARPSLNGCSFRTPPENEFRKRPALRDSERCSRG